jgi:hypothetical protein
MKEQETGKEKPGQLLTEELKEQLPALYSQENERPASCLQIL